MISLAHLYKSIFAGAILLLMNNSFAQNIVQQLESEGYKMVRASNKSFREGQSWNITFKNSQNHEKKFSCSSYFRGEKKPSCRDIDQSKNISTEDALALMNAADSFPGLEKK